MTGSMSSSPTIQRSSEGNAPSTVNFASSYTADAVRQYEERLNNPKSFSWSPVMPNHPISPPGVIKPCKRDIDYGASTDSIPSTTPTSGGFSAETFHRYEQRLESSTTFLAPPQPIYFASPQSLQSEDTLVPSSVSRFRAKSDLESSSAPEDIQLPPKRQPSLIRAFRHTLWNVYRRLFTIVFAANMVAILIFIYKKRKVSNIDIWDLATAASVNIFVGTAIRVDYIQGILYRSAWLVPHSAPLRLRRIVAKIYENGGVHSGCGVAATFWFTALTVTLSVQFSQEIFTSRTVLGMTFVLQFLLLMVIVLAYPTLRAKFHNTFEMTHRFAGWTITILFWIELGLLSEIMAEKNNVTAARVLLEQPSFWFTILITIHTILPWVFLRRWKFETENLSNHAIRLHFKRNVSPFTGIAISTSPLFEWHPFATMPSLVGEPTGGSLIVSAAGDWTKEAVKSSRKYYWVKGVPKPGVLGMSLIFKRVVVVTTGSGIGPCLSILASPHRKTECRVLWSSPSPEGIFGPEVVQSVRSVDPLAMIIDTKTSGRPDMVALTYRLYVESKAEAVFVISNPKLTRKIVYGMESRGVPAFGPVWDS